MSFEPPIGVIGIGLMGEVFARRLVGAGFGVVGYDIDRQKSARLEEFGAHAAGSIADVARAARPILLAVFDTDEVERVVEQEILPACRLGGGSAGRISRSTTVSTWSVSNTASRIGLAARATSAIEAAPCAPNSSRSALFCRSIS